MDNKQKSALALAVAASLGGVGVANAATIEVTLLSDATFSGNGSSNGNISSSTATWTYDTVTSVLTQTGGTFNVRFNTAPFTTIFRHSITGLVTAPLGAASGTTFVCAEGNFGASVGASICGNYSFGANFVSESTTSWGPGTATAKTLGGDDVNFGPIQAINAYNYFAFVSQVAAAGGASAAQNLILGNASCNVYAPGNANGCATVGGFNTGYRFTLSTVPVPGAVWLFGSALGLLGVARRRAKA